MVCRYLSINDTRTISWFGVGCFGVWVVGHGVWDVGVRCVPSSSSVHTTNFETLMSSAYAVMITQQEQQQH